ncbi:MAG TPA: hypothetical protein VK747_01335 [Blastocatellia bacterium]|nr:hypothetical protein [Blastocatellia bacterium]
MSKTTTSPNTQKTIRWSRQIGLVGFMFFLVKGLLWVGMVAVAWRLR